MAKNKAKEKVNVVDEDSIDVDLEVNNSETTAKDKKNKKNKKDKSDDNFDGEAPKKGGKFKKLSGLLLLLFFIASIVGYIFIFNGFGLRDGILRPFLENVPVVSDYLPASETPVNYDDLEAQIEQLKAENEALKLQIENNTSMSDETNAELERLKEIEAQQTEFVAMKEEFDKNFASMTSEDYIKYYEEMYPDLAQETYGELISDKYNKEELDEYIATFQSMEPSAIASILEEMMNTDVELVVLIMNNLDNQTAGETLAEMDPVNAAQIAKLMSPDMAQ